MDLDVVGKDGILRGRIGVFFGAFRTGVVGRRTAVAVVAEAGVASKREVELFISRTGVVGGRAGLGVVGKVGVVIVVVIVSG
jgi:hypothetical protein